jgi:AbrB family looped-hinge helix DNA binding protein
MIAKVSKKGQITIPADVRRILHISSGAYVQFKIENNQVQLLPLDKGIEGLLGAVKVNVSQDFMEIRKAVMEERSRDRNTCD